jgi:phosphate/sulfate permease
MGIFRFYWLVIRTAWGDSIDLTHKIIYTIVIVGGAAAFILPRVTVNVEGSEIAAAMFGAVIAARLIWAPYSLWKKEREATGVAKREAEELRGKLDGRARIKAIADNMGKFLEQGSELIFTCRNNEIPIQHTEIESWCVESQTYIESQLGKSFSIRYRSISGLQIPFASAEHSKERKEMVLAIWVRLARLHEFIKELGVGANFS